VHYEQIVGASEAGAKWGGGCLLKFAESVLRTFLGLPLKMNIHDVQVVSVGISTGDEGHPEFAPLRSCSPSAMYRAATVRPYALTQLHGCVDSPQSSEEGAQYEMQLHTAGTRRAPTRYASPAQRRDARPRLVGPSQRGPRLRESAGGPECARRSARLASVSRGCQV
jgi:hypothetical protein